jgi:MFS family permease
VFIVIAGVIFILPFFLELVKHYPTQRVGLLLAVSPVLGGIVAPASGSLSDRFERRIHHILGAASILTAVVWRMERRHST